MSSVNDIIHPQPTLVVLQLLVLTKQGVYIAWCYMTGREHHSKCDMKHGAFILVSQ